jgi:hypothetical protein
MKSYIVIFCALAIWAMIVGNAAVAAAYGHHLDPQIEDQAWITAQQLKISTCDKEFQTTGNAEKYESCFSDIIIDQVMPYAVDKTLLKDTDISMNQPAADFDAGKITLQEFQLEISEIFSYYYMQRSEIIASLQDQEQDRRWREREWSYRDDR